MLGFSSDTIIIALSSVNLKLISYGLLKDARSDTNRAHKSSLYMTQATYRDDYAASRNAMARSKFIHELAHIWQSHNGKDLVGEAVGLFFRHGGDYDVLMIMTCLSSTISRIFPLSSRPVLSRIIFT